MRALDTMRTVLRFGLHYTVFRARHDLGDHLDLGQLLCLDMTRVCRTWCSTWLYAPNSGKSMACSLTSAV